MTNSIQCENIVKKYKEFSLKSVSLQLNQDILQDLLE